MSKLITELKQEHQEITKLLLELQQIGITSPKGFDLLIQSKTKLLEHLDKEDTKMYPVLFEKAKTDSALKRTLDLFAGDMEKITEFVLDFYEKYSSNNSNNNTFIKDVAYLIASLKNRIMKEEIIIYKAYEKLDID